MKPKPSPIERIRKARRPRIAPSPAKSYEIPAVVTAEKVLAWAKRQSPHLRVHQREVENDLVICYLRSTYGITSGWMAFENGCIEEPFLKTFKVDAPLSRVLRRWCEKHRQDRTQFSKMLVFVRALERELAVEEQHAQELAHLASLRATHPLPAIRSY